MSRLYRFRIALTCALFCLAAACENRRADPLSPKNCPADSKAQYVTVFFDGQLAAWNVKSAKNERLNIPGSPPFEQIKNVHIASHTMSYRDIARRYDTCPRVEVELWETKTGDWRPNLDLEPPSRP